MESNDGHIPEFTNEELLTLMNTAVANSWVNSCRNEFWGLLLFRNYLKGHAHLYPSLTAPFKDLPLLFNRSPLNRYPAEAFSQGIARWRLQIGK